jgi:DNA-binding transcriptional regulator YiaG
VAEPGYGPGTAPAATAGADPIEVVPVVVISQTFPARPSSIPDIRDFVRRCLAESPLTEEGNREVGETVFRALLDAAGPTGSIQVSFRIFPEHVEVDVLHSDTQLQAPVPSGRPADHAAAAPPATAMPTVAAPTAARAAPGGRDAADLAAADLAEADRAAPAPLTESAAETAATAGQLAAASGQPGHPDTFAEWMSTVLRREGLTQEAAARQLGVSVKTVSRWVGGATEPRMRDLRRIQERFGEVRLR